MTIFTAREKAERAVAARHGVTAAVVLEHEARECAEHGCAEMVAGTWFGQVQAELYAVLRGECDFDERDCGGVLDGAGHVYSDADPGL